MREQELDKDFLASFIIQEMCLCIRKTIVGRRHKRRVIYAFWSIA